MSDDDPAVRNAASISDDEWNAKAVPLLAFGPSMESLLGILISQAGIAPHSIQHRIKDRESAARKVSSRARTDYTLGSLTDLLGVRIITYFDQEVDRVAEVIEREFAVDKENSIDKRAALDPDRFGYLSLHYAVKLNAKRSSLPEYRQFKTVCFEIQVRSILQHAWAEIEHDLGYKTKKTVPDVVKRRFSRLAGLLELADMEFAGIRDALTSYEERVQVDVRESRLGASIDRESLAAYIRESKLLKRLEVELTEATEMRRETPRSGLHEFSSARVNELHAVGIGTLEQLNGALEAHGDVVWRFSRNWLSRRNRARRGRGLTIGICIYYLAIYLSIKEGAQETASETLQKNIGLNWDIEQLTAAREEAESESREAMAA